MERPPLTGLIAPLTRRSAKVAPAPGGNGSPTDPAFETLYRRQERRIYAFALRLTQKAEEAADLTQEAFVKAWQSRERFESAEHFARWLRRVLVNDWINALRRAKPLELDAEREGGAAEIPAPALRDSPARTAGSGQAPHRRPGRSGRHTAATAAATYPRGASRIA